MILTMNDDGPLTYVSILYSSPLSWSITVQMMTLVISNMGSIRLNYSITLTIPNRNVICDVLSFE